MSKKMNSKVTCTVTSMTSTPSTSSRDVNLNEAAIYYSRYGSPTRAHNPGSQRSSFDGEPMPLLSLGALGK